MRALLFLFLSFPVFAQTPPNTVSEVAQGVPIDKLEIKNIPNHNGGLVTYYSGNRLRDSESQTAINVLFDKDSGVVKRSGQSLFANIAGCTSQVRAEGAFTNATGTNYFFAACGGNMYESTGGSFSVIGATISPTAPVYMHQGLGQEWFSDGVDPLWSTNGVSISSYPTAPIAQLNGVYQSRVVLANASGAASTIYLSGYNNGGDYTLPAILVDTNSAVFGLNGLNNGLSVTCVSDAYRDVLLLWNNSEMYGLYGSGYSTFVLRKLADIGCDDNGSVQQFDGKVKWLSSYGIYEWDGANTRRISDNVKDQILNIINTEPGYLYLTLSQTSDWNSGNLCASGLKSCMSDTIIPPSVVPTTWSVIDTSFAGTNFNTTTTTANGGSVGLSQYLAPSSYTTTGNIGFETGDLTNWVQSASIQFPCTALPNPTVTVNSSNYDTPLLGTYSAVLRTPGCYPNNATYYNAYFHLYDGNNGLLYSSPDIAYNNGAENFSIPLSAMTTNYFRLEFESYYTGSNAIFITMSSGVVVSTATGYINVYTAYPAANSYGDPNNIYFTVDAQFSQSNPIYFSTGMYLSPWFDTTFSTPTAGPWNLNISTPSGTSLAFSVRNATSTTGTYSPWVAVTTGAVPSVSQEFIQYETSFTAANNQLSAPSISSVSLSAETTGYFITSCFNTTPNVGWGNLQANVINGNGSISFAVSSGTTCGSVTVATANWTAQTLNQNISIATSVYLGVRTLFSSIPVFISTNQPELVSLTVNWNTSFGRPHLATQVFDNRYWVAYTTTTGSAAENNNVLVYDSMGHWSQFQGINAASLVTYNRVLYAGSSLGDGNIVAQNIGVTDLGNPILFDFRTPDYEISAFEQVDLYDLNLEFASVPIGYNPNMQVYYYVDNNSNSYFTTQVPLSVGTKGLIFDTIRLGQGTSSSKTHTFGFELIDNTNTPITFYRSMIRYYPEDGP